MRPGGPRRHARRRRRERVIRQVRVRHRARAIGAIYYGESSFFAGDDRVGQFLDHDGCGNHVAICWDETGLAAIAFDHESSHGKKTETDTWKRHFVPPPPEMDRLLAQAFDGANRQATETLWISSGPEPRWASRLDGYSSMLTPYTMTPEAVFFSEGELRQTWLELLSLDEAHARLAIRLAEASARGPVQLTAADMTILETEPAEAAGLSGEGHAAAAALAMAGVHWPR